MGGCNFFTVIDSIASNMVMADALEAEQQELALTKERDRNFDASSLTGIQIAEIGAVTMRRADEADMVIGGESGDPKVEARLTLQSRR